MSFCVFAENFHRFLGKDKLIFNPFTCILKICAYLQRGCHTWCLLVIHSYSQAWLRNPGLAQETWRETHRGISSNTEGFFLNKPIGKGLCQHLVYII